jgi:hypothetical protein
MTSLQTTFLLTALTSVVNAQILSYNCKAEAMQRSGRALCVRPSDFNGDGIQDIAILRDGPASGNVEIAHQSAGGSWPLTAPTPAPMQLNLGPLTSPNESPASRANGRTDAEHLMAVGHCVGTSLPDVVVATTSGFVYMFENTHSSTSPNTWASNRLSQLGQYDRIHDLILADINADSSLDLVVLVAATSTSGQNRLVVFYNNGPTNPAGPFSVANSSSVVLSTGAAQTPGCMALWDANRDRIPDAVLLAYDLPPSSNNLSLRLNAVQITRGGAVPGFVGMPWSVLMTGDEPQQMVVADFDNDGVEDVAIACSINVTARSSMHVQRIQGGAAPAPIGRAQSWFNDMATCLSVADVDLDFDMDLVFVTPQAASGSTVTAFRNQGASATGADLFDTTAVPVQTTNSTSVTQAMTTVQTISVGDLSHPADGIQEIVVGGKYPFTNVVHDTIRILENTGIPAWKPYGLGCSGTSGRLTLSRVNNAVRGANYQVTLDNLPSSAIGRFHALSLGFSSLFSPQFGVSLPFTLVGLGAPGCYVQASSELMFYQLNTGASSHTYSIAIPASPSFLGVMFFNQGFAEDPTANSLGVTTSNACQVQIR